MMSRLLTLDCFDDLVSHVPDLLEWKGLEAVLFEEVKRAQSKQLKHNAHMAMVVKPVKHMHKTAVTEKRKSKNVLSYLFVCIIITCHDIWLETGVL